MNRVRFATLFLGKSLTPQKTAKTYLGQGRMRFIDPDEGIVNLADYAASLMR